MAGHDVSDLVAVNPPECRDVLRITRLPELVSRARIYVKPVRLAREMDGREPGAQRRKRHRRGLPQASVDEQRAVRWRGERKATRVVGSEKRLDSSKAVLVGSAKNAGAKSQ